MEPDTDIITYWHPIKMDENYLMYLESVVDDKNGLEITISSEKKYNLKIVINFEWYVAYRVTQENSMGKYWLKHKEIQWRNIFFIIKNSSWIAFICSVDENCEWSQSSEWFQANKENLPEELHYAIYTYDFFIEIISPTVPTISLHKIE
jgi:hypothetical protein